MTATTSQPARIPNELATAGAIRLERDKNRVATCVSDTAQFAAQRSPAGGGRSRHGWRRVSTSATADGRRLQRSDVAGTGDEFMAVHELSSRFRPFPSSLVVW